MVTFYIVRHGQTLLNYLNRTQGLVDSPLTEIGKQTALELGAKLKKINIRAVYTSDMSRTVQTAKWILSASEKSTLPIFEDARLREWCLGNMEAEDNTIFTNNIADWLGDISSLKELNKRLPDFATAIYKHDTTGMAEPFLDIISRLESFFTEIAQINYTKMDSYNVLNVTHAFSIKTLFYLFAPDQLSTLDKIKNATISKLEFNGNIFSFKADNKA